jgi:transglutaminase-like putative cysteine protease
MARFTLSRSRKPRKPAASEGYQVPRTTFAWLLVALVSVILPHATRMPFWLLVMCVAAIIGRILIYNGRVGQPGIRTKLLVVATLVVLLPFQFGRDIFSTDAAVGVLLVGVTLKLLEMHQRRDVLLVIYLCYFAVVAEFLYSQAIFIALYMACCVLLITAALMSLNQTQDAQRPLRTLKMSAVILAQSVPLMLAFFLLFPRISPLWSVPLQANTGTTGLSERMAPGDIGELGRSAEVAFRVKFNGAPPRAEELYWRALTLNSFDGREWSRDFPGSRAQYLGVAANRREAWFDQYDYGGTPIDYNVIMEPTFNSWIYTLQVPRFVDERMQMRRDYQVEAVQRVTQRFTYNARSYPEYRLDVGGQGRPGNTLRLPENGNARARNFANELRAANPDDHAYVNAVLAYFRNEAFFYTLSPATLGANPIDEFLFDTRQGFCEHYASAFTYLMRAAGIPARVVTGYQGGEVNPYDFTLTVRQYDAHAWSEVWFEDTGWTRVDPTAAVAPNRISLGSDAALQQEPAFLDRDMFALVRFRNSALLNDLRLRLEMMDYAWNRFVLNYDQERQFELFASLFGNVTRVKIVLVLISFMFIATLFIAFVVFRKPARNPRPPATQQYLRFCDYLARLGFARQRGETPLHYCERICAVNPQWRNELVAITQAYVELAFAGDSADTDKLKQLRHHVRKFRMLN